MAVRTRQLICVCNILMRGISNRCVVIMGISMNQPIACRINHGNSHFSFWLQTMQTYCWIVDLNYLTL